jgi:hypothetical protein
LEDRLVGAEYSSIAQEVGDFGLVKEDAEGVTKNELVLLKVNSTDSTAGECVASAPYMPGWVVRPGGVVEVELLEENLLWGELFLLKKVAKVAIQKKKG